MSVSYHENIKMLRMNAVNDGMNAGDGPATLDITDTEDVVLITYTLEDVAAGVVGPVLTLLGLPKSANASASGTAALAVIKDSDANIVATGLTVGTSNADVIVSSTTIASGAPYSLTAGTITHAA